MASWSFFVDCFCGVALLSSLSLLMLWFPVLGLTRMIPAWAGPLAGVGCFLVGVLFLLCSSVHQVSLLLLFFLSIVQILLRPVFSIGLRVVSCRILVISFTS